jgi:catechol 2,3-dioxygenase-like lactoylglutathione lyase family enzyme
MINGAHVLLYSKDPEADRAFFRDVLEFRWVDAHEGWLIFALPPAEVAFHPGDFAPTHAGHETLGAALYLMCDNLPESIRSLEAKKVACGPITQASWGMTTTIKLPSGGEIGLYQPRHLTPLNLG